MLGIPGVDPPERLAVDLGSFCQIVSWYGARRPDFRSALGLFCKNATFFDALPDRPGSHAADVFMSQAGGPLPAIPKIGTQGGERRQTVVLHPYSGSARKNWPYERFLGLERWYPVEWAAGPDWVRFDDLMELAQWIAGAALYVGNDSGITHLAAAVGTPVVALFGPTDPEVWGPRGTRVKVVRARSMDEISTAMVRAAIDGLLAGG